MNSRHIVTSAVLVLALCVALPVATSAQMSISDQQDIAALMAEAEKLFDLKQEDAVYLFAGQKQLWSADGRLSTLVHEIVWVSSEYAINSFADRRIPYDHEHCVFIPVAVRTWRDGRWWETGESGKVETLPRSVETAYDYTSIREMMLLHNGVEAPCILEVAYIIEDRAPFRAGADGYWSFQKTEPVVEALFACGFPAGAPLAVGAHTDVPAPEPGADTERGLETMTWKMRGLKAIGEPYVSGGSRLRPHLFWSTWPNWSSLAEHLSSRFAGTSALDDRLLAAVDSIQRESRTDGERASCIGNHVDAVTRPIDTPDEFWWAFPRPATTTYSTAYGHRLDRAILAAALLEKAGLATTPVFIAPGYIDHVPAAPSTSWSDGMKLRIRGSQCDLVYDPQSGEIENWRSATRSRLVWEISDASGPSFRSQPLGGAYTLRLDMTIDAASGKVTGRGLLTGLLAMCPTGKATGVSGEMSTYMSSVVSSVIPGASVEEFSPAVVVPDSLIVGFTFGLDSLTKDAGGRYRLEWGAPHGGLPVCLPDDVALYHQSRQSDVILPAQLAQMLELRIATKGLTIDYLPDTVNFNSPIGAAFSLTANQEKNELIIITKCRLDKSRYLATDWPQLRDCLLFLDSPAQRTVLLKAAKGS